MLGHPVYTAICSAGTVRVRVGSFVSLLLVFSVVSTALWSAGTVRISALTFFCSTNCHQEDKHPFTQATLEHLPVHSSEEDQLANGDSTAGN